MVRFSWPETTFLADIAGAVLNRTSSPPMSLPYWNGQALSAEASFEAYVRAVTRNSTLLSAMNIISQAASEPRIVGRRWRRASPSYGNMALNTVLHLDSDLRQVYARSRSRHAGFQARIRNEWLIRNGFIEELPAHPLVKILNDPNPYRTLADLMTLLVWDAHLAGDWFVYKARGEYGNVQELWRLRPDWVQIIPDRQNFVAGYLYKVGTQTVIFPEEDVIHGGSPNPINDYRGVSLMPAVLPLAQVEDAMTGFLGDFFVGGGNTGPGAILTTKGALNEDAKAEIRAKLRSLFGRRGGLRETLVITQNESSYTKMGLDRGLTDAVPKDINAMIEAHLSMPFGIPGSILGNLIGYESSSYANKRADWQTMWDVKMTPLMSNFDDKFTKSLCPEFAGIDEVCFDLSDIRALQEDQDAMHERIRKDVASSLMLWEEGRSAIGLNPDVQDGIVLVASNMVATHVDMLGEPPEPPQAPPTIVNPPEPDPNSMDTGDAADAIANAFRKSLASPVAMLEAPRRGRPGLANDSEARAIYQRAERLRREHPGVKNEQLARMVGISLATLKRYRVAFRD